MGRTVEVLNLGSRQIGHVCMSMASSTRSLLLSLLSHNINPVRTMLSFHFSSQNYLSLRNCSHTKVACCLGMTPHTTLHESSRSDLYQSPPNSLSERQRESPPCRKFKTRLHRRQLVKASSQGFLKP